VQVRRVRAGPVAGPGPQGAGCGRAAAAGSVGDSRRFSELAIVALYGRVKMLMSGCVCDGLDHEAGVALVEAGQGVVRLTGVPLARLPARRSKRRSPLLDGSWPALTSTIAASQSVLAIRVAPSLMLVPVVMNRLVKSSRCSQLPQSISRPVPASRCPVRSGDC
jgi:hypothetical protein